MSETTNMGIGAQVTHNGYGKGVVVDKNLTHYTIFFKNRGDIEISVNDDRLQLQVASDSDSFGLSLDEVKTVLTDVLNEWSGFAPQVELGERWKGGTLSFQPANPDLKPKELPIETFFHKIVMVRDRLRVMEQKINSSKLDDSDKVDLQQYITRIYGSLTTFNIFFADKSEQFKGMGK